MPLFEVTAEYPHPLTTKVIVEADSPEEAIAKARAELDDNNEYLVPEVWPMDFKITDVEEA